MHIHRAQLRFSDTDALGHVNHARFASLFEDARIALLRSLAGDGPDLLASGVILARLEIDYLRPLLVDAGTVTVRSRVVRVGRSSFAIDYELSQAGNACAHGVSVLVAYDYTGGRSRPLEETERDQLLAVLEEPAPT